MSAKSSYHLDEGGALRLAEVIDAEPRTRGFGNARFVRNVFEAAVSRQAERLAERRGADRRAAHHADRRRRRATADMSGSTESGL